MLICFKAEEMTKNELDTLVASGTYKDYSDVITAAVRNLVLLHQELGSARAVVLGSGSGEQKLPKHEERHAGPARVSITQVPELFRQLPPGIEHEGVDMPDDAFLPNQEVPLDRWPFGQYSKLLPAKVSARGLANLVEKHARTPVDALASRIAGEAAKLTEYLAALDERLDLQRDDTLAVGFPSSDADSAEKSRLRYANQFVGAVNRAGILSGLLVDLKLINLVSGRQPRINLTAPGWVLALLTNPVLDSQTPDGQKFSKEERLFLIDHIHRHVPAEAFAYRAILRAILDGAATPDALDEALHAYVPPTKKDTITDAFITTQRSGVISRMADLSLVARQRTGIRVAYVLTDDGQAFVARPVAA